VPKKGGQEEDDGWILSFVHDEDSNTSQVSLNSFDLKYETRFCVAYKSNRNWKVEYFACTQSHNLLEH